MRSMRKRKPASSRNLLVLGGRLFSSKAFEVIVPFSGNVISFFVVTVFATWNQVFFDRSAAASERNQMVHGQISGLEFLSAIVADTGLFFLPPPGAIAQFARFVFLSGQFPFVETWPIMRKKIRGGQYGSPGAYFYTTSPDPPWKQHL